MAESQSEYQAEFFDVYPPDNQETIETDYRLLERLTFELQDFVKKYVINLANQSGEFAIEALQSAARIRPEIIQRSADLYLLRGNDQSVIDSLFEHIDRSFPNYLDSAVQPLKDDIASAVKATEYGLAYGHCFEHQEVADRLSMQLTPVKIVPALEKQKDNMPEFQELKDKDIETTPLVTLARILGALRLAKANPNMHDYFTDATARQKNELGSLMRDEGFQHLIVNGDNPKTFLNLNIFYEANEHIQRDLELPDEVLERMIVEKLGCKDAQSARSYADSRNRWIYYAKMDLDKYLELIKMHPGIEGKENEADVFVRKVVDEILALQKELN